MKAGSSKLIIRKKLTKKVDQVTDCDNKCANPKHIKRMMSATNQEIEYNTL